MRESNTRSKVAILALPELD